MRQGCIATFVVWLSLAGSAWAAFPNEYAGTAPDVEMRAPEWAAAGTGVLNPAHSRVYALDSHGQVLEGWPAKLGSSLPSSCRWWGKGSPVRR